MFLFSDLSWQTVLMWVVVLVGLMALNEISRRWKYAGIALFIVLPILLTIFVWPNTATGSTGTWFHWVKVYSALAGCIGFMAIRYIPKLAANRWALLFPPAILAINIAEAVIRDFQVAGLAEGMHDGVYMIGGPWNYMNGVAGLINIITITGWMGIFISKRSSKDMVWPDMLWFWIIAYDLWNFAYVYNCVGDHSFYAGAALLISCTIPAFFICRGAWLQHRAHTLAFWMMFTMAVPNFVSDSPFAVSSSHNPTALFVVSALALAANLAVLGWEIYTIATKRRNPLKQDLYTELGVYQSVIRAHQSAPVKLQAANQDTPLVTV